MAASTGRQPKRLLQMLNYLGLLNLLGIIMILRSEQLPAMENSGAKNSPLYTASNTEQTIAKRKSNRHKGINETILFLERAGITVDADYLRLPPWWWIEDQYGEEPVILGLDRCEQFQHMNIHQLDDITIAPTGLFNSGTNLLYQLLQLNCHFPNRDLTKSYHGRAFQPPWGKHTPREFRGKHTIDSGLYQGMVLDAVLPVVLVRHPYDWFKSMCEQPYGAHWKDRDGKNVEFFSENFACPGIVHKNGYGNETFPITVQYGSGMREYESIAHLYNRWNRAWFDTLAIPRLVVRMEDLIFHPHTVVPQICSCAGGTLMEHDDGSKIKIPLDSAKHDQKGHRERSTTFLKAVIKYGNVRTWERFALRDHVAARAVLDKEILDTFHYQHPDWSIVMRNKERQKLD